MSDDTKVKVVGLTKKFGDLLVLNDISFNVKKGDFVCIVGPTGCGKTTFLNLLVKLIEPTSGQILIDGEPADPKKHNIAFVFQEPSAYPWLTVEENLQYGLKIKKVDQKTIEERTKEIAESLGLTEVLKSYPRELSASLEQRVVIGRSFALHPDLLLMDEPYAQMDIKVRYYLEDQVIKLWQKTGSTVLFITHNIEEAVYLSEKCLILSQKPTTIKEEKIIDLPRPRDIASPEFIEEKKSLFPLLILPVIWGTYYVASQKLVGFTSSFTSGLSIRFVVMLALIVIMAKRGELGLLWKTEGVRARLVMIGTLGCLLDWTAFLGLSMSSAATGTALLKCDVLMVNIISVIVYKQKFTWKAWVCTFVMLFGVFMVMGIDFTNFKIAEPGNIFFLLSALFVSINAFVIKSVQLDKKNPICDDVVAFYNNFITMIFFTAASLIAGTVKEVQNIFTDKYVALALLFAAAGQTLVYVVYYHNLRNYPVWLVKVFLLFMPIVSTIITFVLFGEHMVGKQYIGMAVVILGALGILMQQKAMPADKNKI